MTDEDAGSRPGDSLSPTIDALVSRVKERSKPSLLAKDEALAEFLEDASDVAARAVQYAQAAKEGAERAESTANDASAKAIDAKHRAETAATVVKIAGGVAGFFIVILVACIGWVLNKNDTQLDTLKGRVTTAEGTLLRATSDISSGAKSVDAEEAQRRALETRVRNLEEELRVIRIQIQERAAANSN